MSIQIIVTVTKGGYYSMFKTIHDRVLFLIYYNTQRVEFKR